MISNVQTTTLLRFSSRADSSVNITYTPTIYSFGTLESITSDGNNTSIDKAIYWDIPTSTFTDTTGNTIQIGDALGGNFIDIKVKKNNGTGDWLSLLGVNPDSAVIDTPINGAWAFYLDNGGGLFLPALVKQLLFALNPPPIVTFL